MGNKEGEKRGRFKLGGLQCYIIISICIELRGCLAVRMLFCLEVDTFVYISVVFIELCPNILCIYRISTSDSNNSVAKECRNICGVTCISMAASLRYLTIMLRTDSSEYLL